MSTNSNNISFHNVGDVEMTNDAIEAIRTAIDAKEGLDLPVRSFSKEWDFVHHIENGNGTWVGGLSVVFDNEDGQDCHIYIVAGCVRLDDERLLTVSGDNDNLKICLGTDYKIELSLSADDSEIHDSAHVDVYIVAVKAVMNWYNEHAAEP